MVREWYTLRLTYYSTLNNLERIELPLTPERFRSKRNHKRARCKLKSSLWITMNWETYRMRLQLPLINSVEGEYSLSFRKIKWKSFPLPRLIIPVLISLLPRKVLALSNCSWLIIYNFFEIFNSLVSVFILFNGSIAYAICDWLLNFHWNLSFLLLETFSLM